MTIIAFPYLSIVIGMWAWLWCKTLTQPGQLFAFVRVYLSGIFIRFNPEGFAGKVYKALIDCSTCHAGQVSFWYQVYQAIFNHTFDLSFIIISTTIATILDTWSARSKR